MSLPGLRTGLGLGLVDPNFIHQPFNASKGLQMDASFIEFSGLKCKGIILDKVSGFTVRRRASNEPGGLE